MMDSENMYEKWRAKRSRAEPASDFADRVMLEIAASANVPECVRSSQQLRFVLRASLCAAAALAAVVRVIELLSVFAATSIGN